ncbi:hypothetical protein [Pseudomonas oryzihabitans]|uniref:hypothetical protein n=1 Tax=Pseudomonas oryzihabitans TaxID=47885 RepID=UPI001C9B4A8A|nr:hypothetical protein [Pseudomonas oryzihabitans]
MLHPRRGRRRAAEFGQQDLQLHAYLEAICVQKGVYRLQSLIMMLSTRKRIVAVVGNGPVPAGHVALVLFLDEID